MKNFRSQFVWLNFRVANSNAESVIWLMIEIAVQRFDDIQYCKFYKDFFDSVLLQITWRVHSNDVNYHVSELFEPLQYVCQNKDIANSRIICFKLQLCKSFSLFFKRSLLISRIYSVSTSLPLVLYGFHWILYIIISWRVYG